MGIRAVTPAVEVHELSFQYPDGTLALEEVSFSVAAGECVGLVGPSGAGKSTLALSLVGFLIPQQGSIRIAGIQLISKNLRQVRRKIGLIFQNPDDQLFMPTLFDDVAFGLLQAGEPLEQVQQKVEKTLADHGLAGMGRKFPGHLSVGQKRLAALAGVLVLEPEVIVLDEPSSNLDPRHRRNLIRELAGITNTRIIASHDLEMILELCNRVFLLSAGKIVAEGDPEIILADPALMADHGLEVPHSLQARQHEHPRRRKPCLT